MIPIYISGYICVDFRQHE